MTTHSKLIYALKDGNIVSIDEVQSGTRFVKDKFPLFPLMSGFSVYRTK